MVVAIAATGMVAYHLVASALRTGAEDKVVALLQSRKNSLDQYLATVERDIRYHAKSSQVADALTDFTVAWNSLGTGVSGHLRRLYITANPFPAARRLELAEAGDDSVYSAIHSHYHPAFAALREARGYYDIFLFDGQGNLLYTVIKEEDYATNLLTGPWRETGLGRVVRQVLAEPVAGQARFSGFSYYEPSFNAPAGFLAMPVRARVRGVADSLIGVIAVQMPIDGMNDVLRVTSGMGETGETLLVGSDFLMRSQSRFSEENTILNEQVKNPAVVEALAGRSGLSQHGGYRGQEVLSAFAPVDFLGVRWALVSEIDLGEVMAPVAALQRLLIAGGVILAVIAAGVGQLTARSLSRPILRIRHIMTRMAEGDLDHEIPYSGRADEIGDMARTLEVFRENGRIRRSAQREVRRQRDELHHLNRQKNRLFSIIAHDLRSPFNALIGYSELLSQQNSDLSREKINDYAQTLNQAIYQLLDLLENLLEWSRSQMDAVKFSPEDCAIDEIIRASVSVLSQAADEKKLEVRFDPSGLSVHADSNMVKSIMRNLISNAIKFSPRGNRIDIRVRPRSDRVEVTVRDQGIGIEQERQATLFDMAECRSTDGTEGEVGTGLGLTLCREFIERHGGEIWVESAPGRGTSMRFTLPGAIGDIGPKKPE